MGAECGSHKIGESTKHDKNSFGKVWGLVLEKQRNKGDTVDKRFDYWEVEEEKIKEKQRWGVTFQGLLYTCYIQY